MRPAVRTLLIVLPVVGVGFAAFAAGRGSVDTPRPKVTRGSFQAGYLSGREDAFAGFDGGWSYGAPYIVTLRRGGPGITYRFARRWPMLPGVQYWTCGHTVCSHR